MSNLAQNVTVTKIHADSSIQIETGSETIDVNVNALLNLLTRGLQPYLVEWTGSRIPRGAVVNGHTIAWTQHGVVRTKGGKEIGYYNRVVDDLDAARQSMIVFSGEIDYTAQPDDAAQDGAR